MDYSNYEIYDFDKSSAFHMSTGYKERSYQMHWHSYGEIMVAGPKAPNIYSVNQNVYELEEGDFVLAWPMEMHAVIDADREKIVTSTNVYVGKNGNLLEKKAENCHVLKIQNPILSDLDLMKIANMKKDGFKVEKVQCADMFPHSVHVESVCLLTKKC